MQGCAIALVPEQSLKKEKKLTHARQLVPFTQWTLGCHPDPHPSTALYPLWLAGFAHSGPCHFLILQPLGDMELWQQLQQAEMVPPELGPPPRALLGVPSAAEMAGSTLSSPREDGLGASKSLQWIWEELVSWGGGGAIRKGHTGRQCSRDWE